jgi:hypothetical protein
MFQVCQLFDNHVSFRNNRFVRGQYDLYWSNYVKYKSETKRYCILLDLGMKSVRNR